MQLATNTAPGQSTWASRDFRKIQDWLLNSLPVRRQRLVGEAFCLPTAGLQLL